jgi:methylmalonyl-CoA/ethylmalonyl-CoA epimerase
VFVSDLKFAHLGILVKNIEAFAPVLQHLLQARPVSPIIEDPNQQALLQMFRSGQTFLELVAPAPGPSNVNTAIKNGGEGPAHLCFETSDLNRTLERVRQAGGLVFKPPLPAALFGEKRVAFAMLPNGMVFEFVEVGWENGMLLGKDR